MIDKLIGKVMDKLLEVLGYEIVWLLNELEYREKRFVAEAYQKGYEDASKDICRRLDELYSFGFEIGKADALAEAGMIELDDDVTEALGE